MTTDKTTRTFRVRWRDTPLASFQHRDFASPQSALAYAEDLWLAGADGVHPYAINELGVACGGFNSWGERMARARGEIK